MLGPTVFVKVPSPILVLLQYKSFCSASTLVLPVRSFLWGLFHYHIQRSFFWSANLTGPFPGHGPFFGLPSIQTCSFFGLLPTQTGPFLGLLPLPPQLRPFFGQSSVQCPLPGLVLYLSC